jgi:hypothetical protein
MLNRFVAIFDEYRPALAAAFAAHHPVDYKEIVKTVVAALALGSPKRGDPPDVEKITEIKSGEYHGDFLYIIGSQSAYSTDYWYVRVEYGSCSSCDTLERIKDYRAREPPDEEQVKQYMTLALHIVQGLKKLEGRPV